jgi:hypothetical protein
MAHVCYDCKFGYGHPLSWCPGCGRRMTKVKQVEWQNLRDNNWKLEGDKDLYEYFLDGQPVQDWPYDKLILTVKDKYPDIWKLFDLTDFQTRQPTPKNLKYMHGERNCYIYLDNGDLTFYFKKPRLTYRLKGSNLPIDIDEMDMFKEQEFKG